MITNRKRNRSEPSPDRITPINQIEKAKKARTKREQEEREKENIVKRQIENIFCETLLYSSKYFQILKNIIDVNLEEIDEELKTGVGFLIKHDSDDSNDSDSDDYAESYSSRKSRTTNKTRKSQLIQKKLNKSQKIRTSQKSKSKPKSKSKSLQVFKSSKNPVSKYNTRSHSAKIGNRVKSDRVVKLSPIKEESSKKSKEQLGGSSSASMNKVILELQYFEPDSQHDFKPSGRQKLFPKKIQSDFEPNKPRIVLSKLQNIIKKNHETTPLDKDSLLSSYVIENPSAFEESIRVDFLLGEIAGPLEDISYYFTESENLPESWQDKRKKFFHGVDGKKINNMSDFLDDLKKQNYNFWLFDAVMSGKIKKAISGYTERIKSLTNLWDPSKSGNIGFGELFENRDNKYGELKNINISSIPTQEDLTNIIFYDFILKSGENSVSIYDNIYDELINNYNNNELGISVKIRLAVKQNLCIPAVIILKDNEPILIHTVKDGFNVEELSYGLLYIENIENGIPNNDNDSTLSSKPSLKKLINIINVIYDNFKDGNDNIKNKAVNYLYNLLLRFKSSGDHGQADMAKLLDKECVFVSGDNLAYVYSIANKTPTISCYYKVPSGKKENEDDDEDDNEDNTNDSDNVTTIIGKHFIVSYFPISDSVEKYYSKFKENYQLMTDVLITNVLGEDQVVETETPLLPFSDYLIILNTAVEDLNIFIGDLYKNVKTNTVELIKKECENKIESLKNDENYKNIINFLSIIVKNPDTSFRRIFLNNESEIDYEKVKEINRLIKDLTHLIYYIKKYDKILGLTYEITCDETKILNEMVEFHFFDVVDNKLSRSIAERVGIKPKTLPQRTSSRNIGLKVVGLFNNLKDRIFKKKTQNDDAILNEVRAITQENSDNFSKKINTIKKKYADITNSLTNKLLENNFTTDFVNSTMSRIIEIKRFYKEAVINKIRTVENIGGFLAGVLEGSIIVPIEKPPEQQDLDQYKQLNIERDRQAKAAKKAEEKAAKIAEKAAKKSANSGKSGGIKKNMNAMFSGLITTAKGKASSIKKSIVNAANSATKTAKKTLGKAANVVENIIGENPTKRKTTARVVKRGGKFKTTRKLRRNE